jgi:predicted MPP superfamily phosphohydrolase
MVLSHLPMTLPVLADLGVDVMLCGHTHGGQIRPLPGCVIYNSTDWPLHLTSGLLRHQNTLCATSRGLGEAGLPLRVFCPPQLPLFTLRRGPLPGRHTLGIDNLQAW